MIVMAFFFSSRRRHTRLLGDWSSDVCSSDLAAAAGDGARWDVAEGVWETEHENASAVGGDPRVRDVLGVVPGAGVQAAGDAGYYVVRRELDAGVCDAGGAADSRAGIEA